MYVEREIKLKLSPEAAAKIGSLASLRSLKTGEPITRRLDSTYFDTPEFGFRNNGIALRVRRIGQRHVQTLKLPRNGATGVQTYREYEADVEGAWPDIGLLRDKALQARLSKAGLADGLAPVFVTRFDRLTLPIRVGTSEIELAVDRGEIRAGERSMPICEAELELRSGRVEDLFRCALMLHEEVPFTLEGRTKAARGYGLLAGERPSAVKGRPRQPRVGESVEEAFMDAMRAGLDHMRANEAAVLAGDGPEGVHQMRVALRRLRAIVSVFTPILAPSATASLRADLRVLQGSLGAARDWDVFIGETLSPAMAGLPNETCLAALGQAAQAARAKAYAQAHEAVQSPRYAALILRFQLWLETGAWIARDGGAGGRGDEAGGNGGGPERAILPFARCVLDRRLKKLRKLARGHDKLSGADLHAVRIAAKKLRYTGEMFAGLFARNRARPYLKALVALQDVLGVLNDGATATSLLATLAADRKGDMAFERSAGIALGWGAARIDAETARFAHLWRAFSEMKPFWR